jgi:hypothetical protein
MVWPWIVGVFGGVAIAAFAPSLRRKSIAARIVTGLAAGFGLSVLINACIELFSYL